MFAFDGENGQVREREKEEGREGWWNEGSMFKASNTQHCNTYTLCELSYRFNNILIDAPTGFLVKHNKLILKFMLKNKRLRIVTLFLG